MCLHSLAFFRGGGVKESSFQSNLIKKLQRMFPGCMVQKNPSNYRQGIPDLLILYKDRWAVLECKRSANERRQPNQAFYVNQMNEMSFAAFIYPENEKQVLNELQLALCAPR